MQLGITLFPRQFLTSIPSRHHLVFHIALLPQREGFPVLRNKYPFDYGSPKSVFAPFTVDLPLHGNHGEHSQFQRVFQQRQLNRFGLIRGTEFEFVCEL